MNQNRAILAGVPFSGLYAITDEHLMPGELLLAKVEAALRGGCRALQYRNKNANPADKRREAELLRTLCRRYQSLFIINDDIDLAQNVNADGVHIGQTDAALSKAREQLGQDMIIGVSCNGNINLALKAQEQGASYVAFGRFFPSHTKPHAPSAELDLLRRAKQQLTIPIVAIGGITRDNAPRVLAQDADMIAVIHDLFSPQGVHEIEQRARIFTQLFS